MRSLILILVLSCSCGGAEVVEIPLSKIWAWNMPSTIDVKELEPEFFGKPITTQAQLNQSELSLTSQILGPLSQPADSNRRSAFAVKGVGLDALRATHAVIGQNQEPTAVFTCSDQIAVVFFSHVSGCYVRLSRVARNGHRIEINYELTPHVDAELTFHFALIPLGRLPSGKFAVQTILTEPCSQSSPLANQAVLQKLAADIVCESFSFEVKNIRKRD